MWIQLVLALNWIELVPPLLDLPCIEAGDDEAMSLRKRFSIGNWLMKLLFIFRSLRTMLIGCIVVGLQNDWDV